ncbi:RNA polymerase sigma factor [Nitriliruptor alkaliphilus]|uniref:RNA polymerase sigma factor n=1 Tax=Nitriliruptor alkaliphilus TaxID=427918 RepID=UPI00069625B1|nr:hypothetical protein [Nitriliruptor alkaliphilus]
MRYDERDDGELLELAQAGWAPAYAVLVHRHAPALLAAFADDPDPLERVTDVFVRAMRQLPERDPAAPVGPWLFALAGRPVPASVVAIDEETLDPVWRSLAARWPDGRHVHHQRPATRRIVAVLGAIALGIAVPTIVLGLPASAPEEATTSVRAQPLDDEPTEEPEPEELPDFEFPDIGGDGGELPDGPVDPVTPPSTPRSPSPPPPVVPSPAPSPTPEPSPTVEPVEPPPPEPVDPVTDDDGSTDDDGTGDDGTDDDDSGGDDAVLPGLDDG